MEAELERVKNVDLHEREVIEKALGGIGILMGYGDSDSIKEACKSILTAVAYVDSKTGSKLREVVSKATDSYNKISIKEYAEICDSMKQEIEKRKSTVQKTLEETEDLFESILRLYPTIW